MAAVSGMSVVSFRKPFITGIPVYSIKQDNIKYVCNNLSFQDLKQIPAAPKYCGGTIGIIPYYITDNNIFFLLAQINWINKKSHKHRHELALGYIGGGIHHNETPYDGFIRELQQEVPKYAEGIITSLDVQPEYTEILSIESIPNEPTESAFYSILIFHIISVEDAIIMQQPITYNKNVPHEYREIVTFLPMSALPVEGTSTFSEILRKRDTDLTVGLQVYKHHVERFRTKIIENIRSSIKTYYSSHPQLPYPKKQWTSIRNKIESALIIVPESLYKYIVDIIVYLISINKLKTLTNGGAYPHKLNPHRTIQSNKKLKHNSLMITRKSCKSLRATLNTPTKLMKNISLENKSRSVI